LDSAKWKINEQESLYRWEDFNMGGSSPHYQVPLPADAGKPTRRKVSAGVKLSWN